MEPEELTFTAVFQDLNPEELLEVHRELVAEASAGYVAIRERISIRAA